MLRIDIKPTNIAQVEKLLGQFWDELDLDYENEDTGNHEYWTRPCIEGTNGISEKFPKVDWSHLANNYDLHVSINQIIDYKLDDLEEQGLLTYYYADTNGIYWGNDSYPVTEGRSEAFNGQELVDLFYRFENGEDIKADLKKLKIPNEYK